jgi:hypothetical protein
MRGVLLSPVVVLVLWSVIAIVFSKPQQLGNNNNYNMARNGNARQQSRRGYKRMLPNFMGSTASQAVQSPTVFMQPDGMSQQLQMQPQPVQGSTTAATMNGQAMMMMMSPPQKMSQVSNQDQHYMATASVAQVNPELYMAVNQQQDVTTMQQQGKNIPVIAPLGAQVMQQQQQQQQRAAQQQPLQYMATQGMVNNQAMMMAPNVEPQLQGATRPAVAHRPHPRATMDETASAGIPVLSSAGQEPVMMSIGGAVTQPQMMDANVSPQQVQQQVPQQQPQQFSDASATDRSEQAAPVKQAVYYYDPKDTILSQNGDILSLPKVVYDASGKAHSLSDLNQVPIYVQPPLLGSTASESSNGSSGSVVDLSSSSITFAENLDMQATPAREAVQIPKWGSSTSQDQTIIVATVAVMALLVGALSARRLRSKSFLASCIENETLEDDMAYDSAYTVTGVGGADSSYNTFGGWKGDLEKFDV